MHRSQTDDIGKASGEASGTTSASGVDTRIPRPITEDRRHSHRTTTASGTVATDVSVENGVGIGVSAIGSENDVDFDAVGSDAEVDDTSFMVTYAAGEGKKVKSSATTTDAATSSAGEYDEFDKTPSRSPSTSIPTRSPPVPAVPPCRWQAGTRARHSGSMVADQEDFAVAGATPVSNVFVAFGIEVDGCDDSPVTSTATLSDGNLLADADGDYPWVGGRPRMSSSPVSMRSPSSSQRRTSRPSRSRTVSPT